MRFLTGANTAAGSGLSDEAAEQFVATTLQLIEVCLLAEPQPRRPLINALLQACLDRECAARKGNAWSLTREICDDARRGTDRRFTFGQIREVPSNPDHPSIFAGCWQADCDGTQRRVTFVLTANALPERTHWQRGSDDAILRACIEARGPRPWDLQVEPQSALGVWISRLAGTHNIGQHRGHFTLGVLCDAVQRHLTPLGLSHLLLGPSRRDPPTRPWHAGAFLRREGESFEFRWHDYAMAGGGEVVDAHCVIQMAAEIVGMQ